MKLSNERGKGRTSCRIQCIAMQDHPGARALWLAKSNVTEWSTVLAGGACKNHSANALTPTEVISLSAKSNSSQVKDVPCHVTSFTNKPSIKTSSPSEFQLPTGRVPVAPQWGLPRIESQSKSVHVFQRPSLDRPVTSHTRTHPSMASSSTETSVSLTPAPCIRRWTVCNWVCCFNAAAIVSNAWSDKLPSGKVISRYSRVGHDASKEQATLHAPDCHRESNVTVKKRTHCP